MDSKTIYTQANRLVRRAGTRDARVIAQMLGITVYRRNDFTTLLGMYMYKWRHRMIFISDRLEDCLEQMVLAHEIGHDQFHREQAGDDALQEFSLFRMKNNRMEYEANIFAAHLLLDSNEVLRYARQGYDVLQTASAMGSDVNLVLIKLQEMMKLGYDLHIPYEPDSRFFGKIRTD